MQQTSTTYIPDPSLSRTIAALPRTQSHYIAKAVEQLRQERVPQQEIDGMIANLVKLFQEGKSLAYVDEYLAYAATHRVGVFVDHVPAPLAA